MDLENIIHILFIFFANVGLRSEECTFIKKSKNMVKLLEVELNLKFSILKVTLVFKPCIVVMNRILKVSEAYLIGLCSY